MIFKNLNGGCNKNERKHKFIPCFDSGKCFAKDNAIKKYLVRNIFEKETSDSLKRHVFIRNTLPILYAYALIEHAEHDN